MAIDTSFVNPLMAEHSETAYLVTKGANTGTPSNPQYGADTEAEVVFIPTTFAIFYRDATLVNVGDIFGLISTETGAVPEMNKPIKIGVTTYQMINVTIVRYLGQSVMYKIHCRK